MNMKFPNKRMIYIRPENLQFYNSLEKKSELINDFLQSLQEPEQLDIVTETDKLGRTA